MQATDKNLNLIKVLSLYCNIIMYNNVKLHVTNENYNFMLLNIKILLYSNISRVILKIYLLHN